MMKSRTSSASRSSRSSMVRACALLCECCCVYSCSFSSSCFFPFLKRYSLSPLGHLCYLLLLQCMFSLPRENGLLPVSHADARVGSLPRPVRVPRERRYSRCFWEPGDTWIPGADWKTRTIRRTRTPRYTKGPSSTITVTKVSSLANSKHFTTCVFVQDHEGQRE